MNQLTIHNGRVFLNGIELQHCISIDIKNISPIDSMDVTIHLNVDKVDVQYSPLSSKQKVI